MLSFCWLELSDCFVVFVRGVLVETKACTEAVRYRRVSGCRVRSHDGDALNVPLLLLKCVLFLLLLLILLSYPSSQMLICTPSLGVLVHEFCSFEVLLKF
ncbi:unnamed protein product [Polarella glacialis]|uniref:Uncharacterized protein n=1 Tax=Polarella glacialis TaxID=89957 RepID=A0A813H9J8_POLGL|nr:unnamed protein product [Polarella glacialis]CAE8634355.1 unnamed protein product [Polarella glacialis]